MNRIIKITLIMIGIFVMGFFVFAMIQQDLILDKEKNNKDMSIVNEEKKIEEENEENKKEEGEDSFADEGQKEKDVGELIKKESEKKEEDINEEVKETAEKIIDDFIQCLKKENVVIYGASWCFYCKELVESFGGYEIIEPIYIECTEKEEKCREEMLGGGYPEIQINEELYRGPRDPEKIAELVGCM